MEERTMTWKGFLTETAKAEWRSAWPKACKKVNAALMELTVNRYERHVPLGRVREALNALGFELLDEEGAPWSGLLCGDEGRATFDLSYLGTPVPRVLVLSWYRMPSGNFETVAYVS
jgi:hypothetical protein